jgi:hypothetical protein
MNKLFTILCTLVFITACGGSSSWDGQWSGVEKHVKDITLKISDGSVIVLEDGDVEDTCAFDVNESEPIWDCEKEDDKMTMTLEGDVLTLSSRGKVATFSRK